jgi:hypothetical protein
MRKRFQLYPYQYIAIPLLFLLPVLALLRVFDAHDEQITTTGNRLAVTVEYPTRTMYQLMERLTVEVENVSGETLSSVTVRIAADYMGIYTNSTFSPPVDALREGFYEFVMNDVQPGETREVNADIQSDQYGAHSGVVTVSDDTNERVEVRLDTFVFP